MVISAWDPVVRYLDKELSLPGILCLDTGINGYFWLGSCLGTGINGYFCLGSCVGTGINGYNCLGSCV